MDGWNFGPIPNNSAFAFIYKPFEWDDRFIINYSLVRFGRSKSTFSIFSSLEMYIIYRLQSWERDKFKVIGILNSINIKAK